MPLSEAQVSPSPSLVPDATPSPVQPSTKDDSPTIGFTGKPLTPNKGDTEFKERTPDGGYFLWRIEDVNGRKEWMPVDFFDKEKGTEA